MSVYRNSQFVFFSEMSKYVYMLVTDCWLLHMLHSLAIFKLFSTRFRDRHGTSVCFMNHHWKMITLFSTSSANSSNGRSRRSWNVAQAYCSCYWLPLPHHSRTREYLFNWVCFNNLSVANYALFSLQSKNEGGVTVFSRWSTPRLAYIR